MSPQNRTAATGGPHEGRSPAATDDEDGRPTRRLWRAGRTAWALVGLAVALVILGYVASALSLVVVPVILALFPATLLVPVASWLKGRGAPSAVAAIATLLAGILVIVAVFAGLVPVIAAQAPELATAAAEGVGRLQRTLSEQFGVEVGGLSDLMERAQEQMPEAGELASRALEATIVAFETIAGVLLLLVVLFFYLKDGRRLTDGLLSVFPDNVRPHAAEIADRAWATLGAYFRGQLLVALVDAVLIGIGLVVLGVPLAVPLAVLVFFGGLFPVVGALVTGALAVLVALADGGLTLGLIVLALVLVVQQTESNILEPLILGRAIHLHPLVVLLSISAGAILLGVLGAFLAVPVAAAVSVVGGYIRERSREGGAADGGAAADEAPPGAVPAGGG